MTSSQESGGNRAGFGSNSFGQLDHDREARQFGETRQRSFGRGGWGGAEPASRGFGGLHRR